MFPAIVFFGMTTIGAGMLSLAQAWALSSRRWVKVRYFIGGSVSTVVLAAPVFVVLGVPPEIAPSHRNVAWAAVILAAGTTVAIFTLAHRVLSVVMPDLHFQGYLKRLFPAHLGMLIALGALDFTILSFMFLGNTH